jgi:hypothetical protein
VSAGQRIGILVAAILVLAGAFVLARGSDDEGGSESARTAGEQTTASPADEGTVTSEGTGGATAPPAETQPAEAAPRVETIRMRGRAPVGEPKTITFDSGDTVRLRFVSDVAEEVHIHGYDRYVNVPAGGSARTRFKANAEGIFEIESHGSGELLAKLQVQP